MFNKRITSAITAITALFIAYLFASWAIDSGSIVAYTLAIIATYYGIHYLVKIFKSSKQEIKDIKKKTV